MNTSDSLALPKDMPTIHGGELPQQVVKILEDYSASRETCSGAAYEIHMLGKVGGHDFTGTACSEVLIWCWQRRLPTGG